MLQDGPLSRLPAPSYILSGNGDHFEIEAFEPADCGEDGSAMPAVSRGAGVAYYKSDCGAAGVDDVIFWYEF